MYNKTLDTNSRVLKTMDPDQIFLQNPGIGCACITKPWIRIRMYQKLCIQIRMYYKTLDPGPHNLDSDPQLCS